LPFVSLISSIADGSGKGDNRPRTVIPGLLANGENAA
jgi:hypothetical protein